MSRATLFVVAACLGSLIMRARHLGKDVVGIHAWRQAQTPYLTERVGTYGQLVIFGLR